VVVTENSYSFYRKMFKLAYLAHFTF